MRRCTNSREGDADEDAEGDASSDGPSMKLSTNYCISKSKGVDYAPSDSECPLGIVVVGSSLVVYSCLLGSDRSDENASGSAFYTFQTSRDRRLIIIHKVKMAVCRVNSADIFCGKNDWYGSYPSFNFTRRVKCKF